jgi:hypothetical protein
MRRAAVHLAARPVTDFIAPLILLPAQLGGNNIGVLAASLFPRATALTARGYPYPSL